MYVEVLEGGVHVWRKVVKLGNGTPLAVPNPTDEQSFPWLATLAPGTKKLSKEDNEDAKQKSGFGHDHRSV